MSMNGIDIASHQAGINLSVVPCDFVIVKATQGTSYVNPDCNRAYQQAKAAGKCLGVYHYASGGDAKAEAEFFLKNVQGYIGETILALDWESDQNPLFGKNDAVWVKTWLDYVYSKTGVRPLLYTSQSIMSRFSYIGDYGLWIAQYADNNTTGYQAVPWNEGAYHCVIRQYSSHGRLSGWPGDLDLDKFYGDKSAWDKYAGKAVQDEKIINATIQPNSGADYMRLTLERVEKDIYKIKDKANGFFLTAADGTAGANVDFRGFDCGKYQLWQMVKKPYKAADYTMFESVVKPGLYLSVENNGQDGKNNLKLWTDLHNQKQKFYIREESDGSTLIIHAFSGKCVAAKN